MSRVRFTVIVRVKVSVSLSIHIAEIASVLSIIRLSINTICLLFAFSNQISMA